MSLSVFPERLGPGPSLLGQGALRDDGARVDSEQGGPLVRAVPVRKTRADRITSGVGVSRRAEPGASTAWTAPRVQGSGAPFQAACGTRQSMMETFMSIACKPAVRTPQ